MKYILKKFTTLLVTLLIISFLVFWAFTFIPGDAASTMLGIQATPEKLAALRHELGLDQPLLVRYVKWLIAFLKGDFGQSYSYHIPVRNMILEKVPITITLTCMATVLMVGISIPLGIVTAKHNGKLMDRIFTILNQFMMSIPSFFMGILITYILGLVLKLFTPGGFVNYKEDFGKFLYYLFYASIAIAVPKIAMSVKLLKTSILQEAKKDYTRTAYSKGNNTSGVLLRHVLQNALIPNITFWGMALADMIVGSIIIEQVFNIPGLGRILLTSISNRDFPVVEAIIMLIAILVMTVNFLMDILYQAIDPRISIE